MVASASGYTSQSRVWFLWFRCVKRCSFSPGLPKQDSGHWWSSFFFGKQPGMTPLTEEAQQKAGISGTVTTGQITCIAKEMVLQRQASESSEAGSRTSS
ncbi:pancreatic progenitor cell differentiation and proliferation factor B-like [Poecilia formosa]|uniref:pancreatic progenitor cell differentiation and proliferation factor B-like n=1 Tax=Poecilia formosa TaxID=48698 RepID=UPI000443B1EC|nr:PREDICTED: pancreatic progenitor cell differentiation and proliferation factor B-like [Poecilia formosa]